MPRLALGLLGPLEIVRDGRPLALPYDKVRALLVYLAAEPARRHPRGAVADLLWPEQGGGAARHSLCQALTMLRHALGEDAETLLAVTRQDVALFPASDTTIDYVSVSQLLAECDRHPHHAQSASSLARPNAGAPHAHAMASAGGTTGVTGMTGMTSHPGVNASASLPRAEDCEECVAFRTRIAELYRGPFLADLPLATHASADAAPFAEWATNLRGWLHERVGRAVAALADYHERHGDDTRALSYAWRQLAIDPLCEDAHRRVMRRLAAAGDRGAALAHYARCRQRLAADADLAPEPETTALYEEIRLRGRAAGA